MREIDKVSASGNRLKLQCSREYFLVPESKIETGTGAIYKATDIYFGRNVAVKLVHIEGENPRECEKVLENAKKEVRSIIRICNNADLPIPRIYDEAYDSVNKDYYIVMDWIEGQTLRDYIKDEGEYKNTKQFLYFIRDLCDIIGNLNKERMFHKDIKPENIIVKKNNFNWKIYLIDFNISGNAANRTEGTKYYKAPEMDYNSKNPDRSKVDIFAIGVILYEYFLGTVPQPGSEYSMDKMGLKKDWKSFQVPKERVPGMPEKISEIITKAMAFDPNKRYRSAWDMKKDILEVIKKIK